MWLKDMLPGRMPNSRIMTFGYGSDVSSGCVISASYIRDTAMELLKALQEKRDTDVGFQITKNIINLTDWIQCKNSLIFVCHSLGGIIVKEVRAHQPRAFKALTLTNLRQKASLSRKSGPWGTVFFHRCAYGAYRKSQGLQAYIPARAKN